MAGRSAQSETSTARIAHVVSWESKTRWPGSWPWVFCQKLTKLRMSCEALGFVAIACPAQLKPSAVDRPPAAQLR